MPFGPNQTRAMPTDIFAFGTEVRAASISVSYDAPMKMIALVVVAFGLLTAIYGSAVVVPKYQSVNRAWMNAPRGESDRLESQRSELRSRGQSYGMVCIATGLLGLGLAIASRKKPGFPPTGVLIGGAVLTLVGFGVIQGIGNVF